MLLIKSRLKRERKLRKTIWIENSDAFHCWHPCIDDAIGRSVSEQGENLLITGATGCEKSYLACALGHQACHMGMKTIYFSMNRFIERITLSKLDGSYLTLLNHLERQALIILDDFGLQPLQQDIKLAILQILEERHGKRSTIITSQLPVSAWHEYIDEPTIADAIMDRLTASAHRIELKGESMRRKSNAK